MSIPSSEMSFSWNDVNSEVILLKGIGVDFVFLSFFSIRFHRDSLSDDADGFCSCSCPRIAPSLDEKRFSSCIQSVKGFLWSEMVVEVKVHSEAKSGLCLE